MATKTFYAMKDMRDPTYRTRMLKAGDPVELDGPKGRIFTAIGAVSAERPVGVAAKPAPKKPAARKRTKKPAAKK